MKKIMNLLIVLISIFAVRGETNEFRPYSEFYEKGKEHLRLDKYLEFKNSDISKAYQSAFGEGRAKLSCVMLVEFDTGIRGPRFFPKSSETIEINDQMARESSQLVSFFSKAFPENTKRPFSPFVVTGAVFEFKDNEKIISVFVPYQVVWPEFYLVKVQRGKDGVITHFDLLENGAMSANPPPKVFLDVWNIANLRPVVEAGAWKPKKK